MTVYDVMGWAFPGRSSRSIALPIDLSLIYEDWQQMSSYDVVSLLDTAFKFEVIWKDY